MSDCQSCVDEIKCVACQLKTATHACGNCGLTHDECLCWEPNGPLGNDEKYARMSDLTISQVSDEPDH